MKPRSLRSILLATAAAAAGLVVVTTVGQPASAAAVSQTLSCGIGGTQTVNLNATAPATVTAGGTFDVVLAGTGSVQPPAEIKNMVTTFQAPTGSTIVAGSAVASGGSGTLGSVTTSISGSTVAIKVPGPIKANASFTPPTLTFKLQATGAAGTVLKTTIRQNAGYTLNGAGFDVSCNATTPLTTLTSTTIEAAATTTTTTTPTTTTTTKPGATTSTTAATTTTTAPPPATVVWSPTGACGSVQTVVAPANTQTVRVSASGAGGGRSGSQAGSSTAAGGWGATAAATFPATGGQTYSAIVGCAGVNGGSFSNTATPAGYAPGGGTGRGHIIAGQNGASGGSGGGASGACLGSACAYNSAGVTPLVVAGGGGGGGVSNCAGTNSGAGGAAGAGSSTAAGSGAGNSGNNGSSANSSGGAGGVNSSGNAAAGGSNGDGSGGAGVNVVGGAGGGGYVGGGAGSNTSTGCKGAGGGGGGSSWIRSTGSATSFAQATSAGVTLTFNVVTPTTTTTAPTTTTTTTAPCVADKVPFASVQALVTQQYQDFKGAAPTTAQNNQWVPAITNCTATADALIVSLPATDQTLDDARLVRLYLAYFKRPPDPDGFAYWQRQLDNGKGLINAAKKFAESSEFKTKYGTVSNSAFIELVYQNVLGRASDPTGKAFWLTRLDNKTKNRGDVMINFSESSENVNKKVNHVQVFRIYRGMMQKFPNKTVYEEYLNPILNNGKTLNDAAKAIRLSAAYDARV